MEEQIPSSNFPPDQQSLLQQITPEQLEQFKARARETAILQTYQQKQVPQAPPLGIPPTQVVYVKRPLTVAEILLLLLVACGVVFGVQLTFGFVTNTLSRIEIKMK